MLESWKGQKLLSRAEFHVGAHVTKFLRLQMLSTSDRTGSAPGSDKTNRFALLFSTLDGSIGCIAPLDEITFRRLQSLQKKLIDAVSHVAGLNPRAFRLFHSNGKAHRPGPDSIVDCELLCQYVLFSHLNIIWTVVKRISVLVKTISKVVYSLYVEELCFATRINSHIKHIIDCFLLNIIAIMLREQTSSNLNI